MQTPLPQLKNYSLYTSASLGLLFFVTLHPLNSKKTNRFITFLISLDFNAVFTKLLNTFDRLQISLLLLNKF